MSAATPPVCRCGHPADEHDPTSGVCCDLPPGAEDYGCRCAGYVAATQPGGGEGLTPEDVAELRRLLAESEGVSPAPWSPCPHEWTRRGAIDDANAGDVADNMPHAASALIVALRNAAPLLLSAYAAWEFELERADRLQNQSWDAQTERDDARAELAAVTAERDAVSDDRDRYAAALRALVAAARWVDDDEETRADLDAALRVALDLLGKDGDR